MLVFSCGSASLVILALAFNFVLAVHYHGKDMGEQVTDILCHWGHFMALKQYHQLHIVEAGLGVMFYHFWMSAGSVLGSQPLVSLINPPRVVSQMKMKMSFPSFMFEVIHSGGHVLPSLNLYEIVVSLIQPPRVFGPFKMSIPSFMFEIT